MPAPIWEEEVRFTAKVMAAARAIETQRPDALFSDFFAERLAGADVMQSVISWLEEDEKQLFSIRTRFFDDFLMNRSHNIQQVILLGAGLDTRAFRLNWKAGTHVYEIDYRDVLHDKESVLTGVYSHCVRHSICADLKETHWSQLLLEQGYQPSEPSIWLLEGLLYYLSSTEVHNLLTKIKSLAITGSWFGADVINSAVLNGSDEWAKYWQSSCDHPVPFFTNYGWKVSAIQPGEEAASFGRLTYQLPDPTVSDAERIFFITAYRCN